MSSLPDDKKLPTLLTKPIRKNESTILSEENLTTSSQVLRSSDKVAKVKSTDSLGKSNIAQKKSVGNPFNINKAATQITPLIKKTVSTKGIPQIVRSIGSSLSQMKRRNIKIGDLSTFQITALGPKKIGIDEYSYPFPVYIPNANLKDTVKAKLVKINGSSPLNKYGIAKLLKVQAIEGLQERTAKLTIEKLKLEPNKILTVTIKKVTPSGAGILNFKYGYKLIVPRAIEHKGTEIQITITRLKTKYGFAKIVNNGHFNEISTQNLVKKGAPFYSFKTGIVVGSKYTLTLPKTVKTNQIGKFFVLKLQDSILFLKVNLGAKPGDKVRIKITKLNSKFVIGKIIQINPVSLVKKRLLIQKSLHQMIQNGMHLGEKAVKCNPRMKNYVWLKKQKQDQKLPLIKKGNHIINLLKTRRCLNKALTQLTKYALKGRTFLFIGTKKAAAGLIARASLFSKNSFFVNSRWLGGLLTNWKTIRKSISKIRPILQEKQKIVADILEKRKRIKLRLIKKGLFIKNKTQQILNKGRSLLAKFRNPDYKIQILEKTQKLALKQKELLENCQSLVFRHKTLEVKRRKLMYQNIVLKQHIANTIIERYNNLLGQLSIYSQKLRQLNSFLILSNELKRIKNKAHQENTKVLNIGGAADHKKLKTLIKKTSSSNTFNILPQPPKEILNLILLIIKKNSKAFTLQRSVDSDFLKIQTKNSTNQKTLLVSDFLSSLSHFVPDLKKLIQKYQQNMTSIKNSLRHYSESFQKLKATLQQDIEFHQLLVSELIAIKSKLVSQRNMIRLIKVKLNHFACQKRVIKFLPRFRYFKIPSFKSQIFTIVQILMRKIVDPKLKFPVDQIYDSKLTHYSKKIASARKKKWERFEKYFGGIVKMTEMTKSQISKNVAIVIGQQEEMNAIRECRKLGIKMFNIVDTNCNPSLADHIVPANDDSRNSIKFVLTQFLIRIRLANKLRQKLQKKQNKQIAYKKLQGMANLIRNNYSSSTKKNSYNPV
jgi:small subunit ribosomal protein S2